MKKLLRKKADPPQQPAPSPTAQNSSLSPPPLFARFASSHGSTGSSASPPVISGPAPLVAHNSVHKQNRPHDGSPPKPTISRVAASPVRRNRMPFEERVNGGKDDKPLPDPEHTPTQRTNSRTFRREQVQSFGSRTSPMNTNDPSPTPQKSIPESRKREDPLGNADFAPVFLDPPSTITKSEDTIRKRGRAPISSSPERRPSGRPVPVPEPVSSPLLAIQNPLDRPQPRRKYSPLEAFGLVSGESSPAPSTATSSVNLPSQNSVSTSPRTTVTDPCHHDSAPQSFDT